MHYRLILLAVSFLLLVDVRGFAQQPIPLDDLITADGSLAIPSRFQGTIDARGFSMTRDIDGSPRFRRQARPSAPPTAAGPDDAFWDDRFGEGAPDRASLWAIAARGNDIYVAGDFSIIGDTLANGIARWDGTRWHPLGAGVGGSISTMIFMGEDLIVAGSIYRAGEQDVNAIARWDGAQWHSLGPDSSNGVDSYVGSLAASGDDLYVGGQFSHTGGYFDTTGVPLENIGRWNRASNSWHPLIQDGRNGASRVVSMLHFGNGLLYASGSFDTIGGIVSSGIAAWSPALQKWERLGEKPEGYISDMETTPDALYVVGQFSPSTGTQYAAARWDIAQHVWTPLRGDEQQDGQLMRTSGLVLRNGRPAVLGLFPVAAQPGAFETRLVEWDGSRWRTIESDLPQRPALLTSASAEKLVVLGNYETDNQKAERSWIASRTGDGAWDATPVSVRGATSAFVDGIAVLGDDIYMMGSFGNAGDVVAQNLVRWHRPDNTWHAVEGDSLNRTPNVFIEDIVAFDGRIAIAGVFFDERDDIVTGVSIWNPQTKEWSLFKSTGLVQTLASYNGRLYAAGNLDTIGGVPVTGAAIMNPDGRWESLGLESVTIIEEVYISEILPTDDGVYLYGSVQTQIGGLTGVIKWVDNQYEILASGIDGSVDAMALVGKDLVIGGSFTSVEAIDAHGLARYDSTGWHGLGDGTVNGVNGSVTTLSARGRELIVGGSFDTAGGIPARNIARWNGERWYALGSGTNNTVQAVALDGESLYVGGDFSYAGEKPSIHFARWSGPLSRMPEPAHPVIAASLHRIDPNPVRTTATIGFDLPHAEKITLAIVDLQGRRVAILQEGTLAGGRHEIIWNAEGVAAGTYIVTLDTPEGRTSGRIVVVR